MEAPDRGYSDAANKASKVLGAKDQAGEDMQAGTAQENPVMDALKTLAIFIQSQEEQGKPEAAAMKQAMIALMDALKGGAGPAPEAPPEEEMGPEEPEAAPAPVPQAGPPSPGEQFANRKKPKVM